MPYYFTFKINNQVRYTTQVQSIQCEDHTKTGARCKRRCIIGSPYCCTHLAYNHHLKIKPSLIPNAGKGLFAVDPLTNQNDILFRNKDTICEYRGEVINLATLNERYAPGKKNTAPYAVQLSANAYEDAAKIRGVGSLANKSPNNSNATLSVYRGRASLKATKNIRNGDEIYLSYGSDYRMDQPGVIYKTTPKPNPDF